MFLARSLNNVVSTCIKFDKWLQQILPKDEFMHTMGHMRFAL